MNIPKIRQNDTIVALATPPGRSGVGIVRISGPEVLTVAKGILQCIPKPRHAFYVNFLDSDGVVLDQGIAVYFPAPHSFTGEDVLELHAHGSPVLLDCLIERILQFKTRLARPGEFSERAFLNDKIDLAQAEAIADVIDASSRQAARAAVQSLQGEFSKYIHTLVERVIQLRIYVEAAIDFAEEEIDFLNDKEIKGNIKTILDSIKDIKKQASQGALLREGMTIVIAGRPNAGKSSLLNALSQREVAIVTGIPGTTRDVLRERIQIDGLPLHIIDTAGLRKSEDRVEQEGVRRAVVEMTKADRILLILDSLTQSEKDVEQIKKEFLKGIKITDNVTVIFNKCDLKKENPAKKKEGKKTTLTLSAKTGAGIDLLREHLKECVGFHSVSSGIFSARRRHLTCLDRAEQALLLGKEQLEKYRAGELLAEELRVAQIALNEITGEFTTDDLLGKIFSSFCVGK